VARRLLAPPPGATRVPSLRAASNSGVVFSAFKGTASDFRRNSPNYSAKYDFDLYPQVKDNEVLELIKIPVLNRRHLVWINTEKSKLVKFTKHE